MNNKKKKKKQGKGVFFFGHSCWQLAFMLRTKLTEGKTIKHEHIEE